MQPRHGPLQFIASNVAVLSARTDASELTEAALDQLRLTGKIDANRSLSLPDRPQRIGLIAPRQGGAGGADFLDRINSSGEALQITSRYVPMVGALAVESLVDAIGDLGVTNSEVLFICRGGGSRTELASFDSPKVLEAIASSPIPIVLGVGHSTDATAADLVCWASLPTPSAAADWLLQRRRRTERQEADAAATRRSYVAATSQAEAGAQMVSARAIQLSAAATVRRTIVLTSLLLLLVALVAIAIAI